MRKWVHLFGSTQLNGFSQFTVVSNYPHNWLKVRVSIVHTENVFVNHKSTLGLV